MTKLQTAPATDFYGLGIRPDFVTALATRAIQQPTDIQNLVIPRLLAGQNTGFQSATGTGKTLAFLLPMLQLGLALNNPRSLPLLLISAPTNELAAQLRVECDFLLQAAGSPFKSALLTAQANLSRQIDKLRRDKPLCVIGNIGRLLQLAKLKKLTLTSIQFLILDEVDRLLAPELIALTRELIALLPPDCLTAACSATIPPKARQNLMELIGPNLSFVQVDDHTVLKEMIKHWAIFSEDRRKIATLRAFIKASRGDKFLVFTDRNGQIALICGRLLEAGLKAAGLFGGMDKVARKKALDDFRSNRATILITSDLAARGLDIAGVDQVVALNVPATTGAYAHRAGRTGRAGTRGTMTSIGDAVELTRLAALEKRLGIRIYPKTIKAGRLLDA